MDFQFRTRQGCQKGGSHVEVRWDEGPRSGAVIKALLACDLFLGLKG